MSSEETRKYRTYRSGDDARSEGSDRRRQGGGRVPALTVLFHPRVSRGGGRVLLTEMLRGSPVELSRHEPRFGGAAGRGDRNLDDPYISRTPIVLHLGKGGRVVEVDPAGSATSLRVDGRTLRAPVELPVARLSEGVVIELAERIVLLLHLAQTGGEPADDDLGMVGASDAIERVRREVLQVADLDVPVLLQGETGTGKELVAHAIHTAGRRCDGPCVSVNLSAVPASLAASELFGSVKGAFTGADRERVGFFQSADGGTLFLDEVGAAPAEVQVMLLRAIETGEVQRVGAHEVQRVDVRLVAATDSDLESAVVEGVFRAALLHRLAGYEIALPPLRERREDFGRLLLAFLRESLAEMGEEQRLELVAPADEPWLAASIVARLARHPWPGNVRQLRNVARQLVIASRGSRHVRVPPRVERLLREAEALSGAQQGGAEEVEAPGRGGWLRGARRRRRGAPYRRPGTVSEEELLAALEANQWWVKPAAAELGLSRASLYQLIDRCPKVRKASELSEGEIGETSRRLDGDLDAMAAELKVSPGGLQQRLRQLDAERRGDRNGEREA